MTAWSRAKHLALLVIAVLLLACVGDLAHAAMPDQEPMRCSTLLCDGQTGCSTEPTSTAVLPTASLIGVVVVAPPVSLPMALAISSSPVFPSRQFAPLAPRSPPIV